MIIQGITFAVPSFIYALKYAHRVVCIYQLAMYVPRYVATNVLLFTSYPFINLLHINKKVRIKKTIHPKLRCTMLLITV